MANMNKNAGLYKQTLSYNAATGPYQCLAAPWWIRTAEHPAYQPRDRCHLEVLNCGQAVFNRIEVDILAAQRSVDIITWGFDPGMVLVRNGSAENGTRYGELLKEVATREMNPVMVRLLLWHDDLFSHKIMRNNPGFYGSRFPTIGGSAGYFSATHQKYNDEWFDEVSAGKYTNICLHVREVPLECKDAALSGETYDIGAKGWAGTIYPTHHQKMILIDYELPASTVGYVMGHNSTTDFWDTPSHRFCDPLRETLFNEDPAGMISQLDGPIDEATEIYYAHVMPGAKPPLSRKQQRIDEFFAQHAFTAKPYQDVSLRVRGPIVFDLNHNFCEGWSESRPANASLKLALWMTKPIARLTPGRLVEEELCKAAYKLANHERDTAFIAGRAKFKAEAFKIPAGQHSAQLIRTQPMHKEKAIKECYANLTRQIHHYIFIQNQYVQYEDWATHLKEYVQTLRKAGFTKPIYVFILTSTPEAIGMDLPTYGVATKLGQSQTMVVEHAAALDNAKRRKAKSPITPEQMAKDGINVVMGSLWTCAASPRSESDFEEIYIHAKVAIVDDAAFTIGSANLNVRSMALDSELNILSQSKDVAYELRTELFKQSTTDEGPAQFGDMQETFEKWKRQAQKNFDNMGAKQKLNGQLLTFHVERVPGSPLL